MRREDLTCSAGTKLRRLFGKQRVDLATQTDAEGRLEEHQHQAGGADKQVDRTDHVVDDDQVEHADRQRETDGPGKALLRCADVFGRLIPHREAAHDHARRKFRVDEYPYREVDQEGDDEEFRQPKIAQHPGIHERDQGEEEQYPGTRPYFPLVEHGHRVVVHLLAEGEYFAHTIPFRNSCCHLTRPMQAAHCRARQICIARLRKRRLLRCVTRRRVSGDSVARGSLARTGRPGLPFPATGGRMRK